MKTLPLDRISYLASNGTSYDPDNDLTLLARQYLELHSKLKSDAKVMKTLDMPESVIKELRNIAYVKRLPARLYPEIIQRLAVRCYFQKKSASTIRSAHRRLARQLKGELA